jgi:pantothenate kinase type III
MKFATEGIVNSLRKQFKGKLKVFLTGGSAKFLLKKVNFKYIYIEKQY